jgi:hypothetical protein
LIDDLAVHHKEHHFRYPQKARRAELMKPPTVVILTDAVLRWFLILLMATLE